ncbi:MAG: response regulator [Cryobacterium sp.]|nr:response regulator [Oligoflexia bacterium]
MSSLHEKEILLIDDAPEARMLARKILEVDGAIVSEASTIDDGINLIRNKVPHLILVDLEMPVRSGFEFLTVREGDALFKTIPTIVLSGRKDRESIQKVIAFGANDYILKLFRAILLLQKVRKVLMLISFYSRKIVSETKLDATFSI